MMPRSHNPVFSLKGYVKIATTTLTFTTLASGVMTPIAQAQIAPVIQCQGRPVTALSFSTPTLVSGTALQVGSIYRFANVATGVDARVEVLGFVNGGSLSTIDRDTGLVSYLQPELVTTGTSAVDFNISFVQAGTTTPIALDIAASSIDVDGNNVQLREYVEYEDSSVAYVLSANTALDRNVSGPTSGRNRYESRTVTVAPGIDPTAENNIVTVFYTDVENFDFRIGSLGNGNMTRLTSQGYDCPNLGTGPVMTSEVDEDYGDALLNNYGNPIHIITPGIQLGNSNTIETTSGNSAAANSDAGDDGVALVDFTRGQTETVNVNVSGAGGYLQAWIDWNNDGDILDSGEQVAANVQDNNNDGIISLDIATSTSAITGQTIARLRWSTASDLSYHESAQDGEVEDYLINIIDPPPAPLSCPAGFTPTSGTGNAGVVIVDAQNGNRALGPISANGSNAATVSARVRDVNPTLTLQLENSVPENADITVSISRDNNNGNVDIEGSTDGSSYFPLTTFNSGALDVLSHVTLTATSGAVEFIRIQRNSGATWIDGIAYTDICLPSAVLVGNKDVSLYDPTGSGTVYALPGSDVIYTITVSNTGDVATDTDTLFLVDNLPSDIVFWNGDIDAGGPDTYLGADPVAFEQSSGAGLSFNYASDIRFGTGPTAPTDFASCSVITPDNSYRPDLTFLCINPKGALAAGNPDEEFSVSFRAQIK